VDNTDTFLKELVDRAREGLETSGVYTYRKTFGNWVDPGSIYHLLGTTEKALTDYGRSVLELHEKQTNNADWLLFKWQLAAFQEIQDVFDAPLLDGSEPPLNMFQLWYFYYESRRLLAEAVICTLNGLYSAMAGVSRTFLEFNISQLYYYRVSIDAGSYHSLEQYFKTRVSPSWHTMLKRAIPDDEFCKPIKTRLNWHLQQLSKSSAHAYHPEHSARQFAGQPGIPSLEGIYSWQLLRILLQGILWAYYVNFPILFHPRDVIKKFGFNGPVGVVVGEQCHEVVKKTLEPEEYGEFKAHSLAGDKLSSVLNWIDTQQDLTEEEVVKTWRSSDDGEFPGIEKACALQIVKLRVLREMMALRKRELLTEDNAQVIEKIFTYSAWRKAHHGIRKR